MSNCCAARQNGPTQRRIPNGKTYRYASRVILSAASQRDDRGVELPPNGKGEAARKVVDKLIRAGLLEEVRAGGSLPVWRGDDESGTMALRITKTGLKAIDVEDEPTAAAKNSVHISATQLSGIFLSHALLAPRWQSIQPSTKKSTTTR